MAIGENRNDNSSVPNMSDLSPASNLKFRRIFNIIKIFDLKGFYSEFRRNDLSELKPFGSKTVWDKNRSEQWCFGIKIFGAMTIRIISLSNQRTKYSSEKRPFEIKTFRNKNRSE